MTNPSQPKQLNYLRRLLRLDTNQSATNPQTTLESKIGSDMDNPEIVAAIQKLDLLNTIKNIGAVLVVVGVSMEVLGDWFSTAPAKFVDNAREMKIMSLKKETADLEKQNLEMRQKLANRRLTKEQSDILVKELSKKPMHFSLREMSDMESTLYAQDFLRVFKKAGWEVTSYTHPVGEKWEGLVILYTADPTFEFVSGAFKAAGIPFTAGWPRNDKESKGVTIIVGYKASAF